MVVKLISGVTSTPQIVAVCIISVLRCVVSMTVNAATSAGDVADKVTQSANSRMFK